MNILEKAKATCPACKKPQQVADYGRGVFVVNHTAKHIREDGTTFRAGCRGGGAPVKTA